jgi:cathepsin L
MLAVADSDSTCPASDPSCEAKDFSGDAQSALVISTKTSSGLTDLPSFASFIEENVRTYSKGSPEYEMRRGIYLHRLQDIHNHNSNAKRRWNAAVNHMADRTDVELAQLRGLRAMKKSSTGAAGSSGAVSLGQEAETVLPEEKLWTHLKSTTRDMNQRSCGSCWAVATATMLNANAEIKGYQRTFSPQELVSCVPNPYHCGGDGGCKGSTVELAMNWVMEKGLDTMEGTPYHAEGMPQDGSCKKEAQSLISHNGDHYYGAKLEEMIAEGLHEAKGANSAGARLGLRGWERLPENKYAPLMHAVAFTGPVGVSVGAHPWHNYGGGVFDGCKKDAVIDHAVLLVGYGKDKDTNDKYWVIKNSWSLKWGEQGNIRLLRHEGDAYCGTDHQPKVGTACDGGPATVPVCGMCGILYDSVVPYFNEKV